MAIHSLWKPFCFGWCCLTGGDIAKLWPCYLLPEAGKKGIEEVFVAASTACYAELALAEAVERLADLSFGALEITIHAGSPQLTPEFVTAELEKSIAICAHTNRMDVIAYDVIIAAEGETYYQQFEAICQLAKATKVISVTVPSAELGTPFNEEIERLRRMVKMGVKAGINVSIRSQIGCLSENPDTVISLCDNVEGLGITLDPSHYICGPYDERSCEKLMKYVSHVRLRDSTEQDMQVRVGQGIIEYGRLVNQLSKVNYRRTLCVHITELPDIDHVGELRKMRLLLESLL